MPALHFLIIILGLPLSAHADYKISYEGRIKTTKICDRSLDSCKEIDLLLGSKHCFIELNMTENLQERGMSTHYAKRGTVMIPGALMSPLINREYQTEEFFHNNGKTAYLYRGKINEFAAYIEGSKFTTSVLYDNSKKPYPYAVNYIFSLQLKSNSVLIECDDLRPLPVDTNL